MKETRYEPYVVVETAAYLVLYKPPLLHSVPLKHSEGSTLLSWCAEAFPDVMLVRGLNQWEGGILHRLDYETRGLVLCARNQSAFDALFTQQKAGMFIKQYKALSAPEQSALLSGFPPRPHNAAPPFTIKSAFRAYGQARKAVRPLYSNSKNGVLYSTNIIGCSNSGTALQWTLSLCQGFRHQVRCHLSWLGYPILNDSLYGGKDEGAALELCAESLSFFDPISGKPLNPHI